MLDSFVIVMSVGMIVLIIKMYVTKKEIFELTEENHILNNKISILRQNIEKIEESNNEYLKTHQVISMLINDSKKN